MRAHTLLILFALGCQSKDDAGFNTYTPSDDSEPTTDDSPADPDAPVLLEVRAARDDYPGIGDVIEVTAICSDTQGDIEGGTLNLIITDSHDTETPLDVTIDGSQYAQITQDDVSGDWQVVVVFTNPDPSEDFLVRARVTDLGGNRSEWLETELQ